MTLHGVTRRSMTSIAIAVIAVLGGATYVLDRYDGRSGGSSCPSVEVAFARGTGEPTGLGHVGKSFVSSLTQQLADTSVNAYAVDYAAADDQRSVGAGSIDLVNHIQRQAAVCPQTRFILAGYSQGASVVDFAIGLFGTSGGEELPAAIAPRVKAIVVFGNPLGLIRSTIETASLTYGALTRSYCSVGDPVCGGGFDVEAHRSYVADGSTANAARFAADRLS
jgi:cutinase